MMPCFHCNVHHADQPTRRLVTAACSCEDSSQRRHASITTRSSPTHTLHSSSHSFQNFLLDMHAACIASPAGT